MKLRVKTLRLYYAYLVLDRASLREMIERDLACGWRTFGHVTSSYIYTHIITDSPSCPTLNQSLLPFSRGFCSPAGYKMRYADAWCLPISLYLLHQKPDPVLQHSGLPLDRRCLYNYTVRNN